MSRHTLLVEFDSPLIGLESPRLDTAGTAPGPAPKTAHKVASNNSGRRHSTGAALFQPQINKSEEVSTKGFEYDWPLDEFTIEDKLTGLRWLNVTAAVDRKELYKSYHCVQAGTNASGHKLFVARTEYKSDDGKSRFAYGSATTDDAFCFTFDGKSFEYAETWQILLAPPSGYAFGWMNTPNSEASALKVGEEASGRPVNIIQFLHLGTNFPGLSSSGDCFYVNGSQVIKISKGFMTLCMAAISAHPSSSILTKKTFDKKALYSIDPGTSTPKTVSSSSAAKVKGRRASIATAPSMISSASAPAFNITKDEPTPLVDIDDLLSAEQPIKEKKKRRLSLVFGK